MSNVFIVVGESGSYSDHSQWIVRAFLDEKEADEFCEQCEKEANSAFKNRDGKWDQFRGTFDPQMTVYSRCSYSVEEVPLGFVIAGKSE